MKKLFKFISAALFAALGLYFVYIGISALIIQGVAYAQIAVIVFGLGLVLVTWAILSGHSVREMIDTLLVGFRP